MKRIIVQVYFILLFATILANSATFEFPKDQKTDWQKYEYTMGILKTGQYEVAEKAFIELIALAWDRELLSSSYFWLGETYFVRENYKQAAKQYLALYQKYPDSEKAPNALFKLGTSLFKMKEKEQGCLSFNQLLANYPVINEKLKDRVTLDYKKNNCKTIIVSSNQDSNTEVASTTEKKSDSYNNLSHNDYFYCKDNNGPYYHKFNKVLNLGVNFDKSTLFRAHSSTCNEGDRISLSDFCKFERTAKLKVCEGFETQDFSLSIIIASFKKYPIKNGIVSCKMDGIWGEENLYYTTQEKCFANKDHVIADSAFVASFFYEIRDISDQETFETELYRRVLKAARNGYDISKFAKFYSYETWYQKKIEERGLKIPQWFIDASNKETIFVDQNENDNKKILTPAGNKVASSITDQYVCLRATKSDGSSFESFSSNYADYVEEADNRGLNLESCNQLTGRGTNQTVTQTVQVPMTEVDKIAPTLEIEDRIIVDTSDYTIRGKVFDDSKVYVQVDGNTISSKNGSFTINGYIPIGEQRLTIVAKDQWGNTSKKNITVERVMRSAKNNNSFEKLNPNKIRSKKNKNRIALIIGIEKYNNISDAKFAKNDAVHFIDYAQTALGVPQNNIKYFFDESAGFKLKIEIKRWLKRNVRKNSEVFIYFSGHGIAQNDGQELYLLTNNTESDFIHETAINRNEIFNDIAQYNPKSVNVFLDTCYSGAGRADGEILLAMAKGLVVVDEQQQQLPDNFTLFTAASAQESAWSLPEVQHGTFSYFLMKGMEGEADLNNDKKLTNGELQEYLLDNVGRYAQQQQTPQMIGNPDQVLVRF